MVKHWNYLTIEAVYASFPEMFKVRWVFGKPALVEGVPTHGKEVELEDF